MEGVLDRLIDFILLFGVVVLFLIITAFFTFHSLKKSAEKERQERESESKPD